ncbi:putative transcription factor interactor and regulator CCHC(Zn) family [Helianthus annuus]|nr:putative transcription factor interactor and regulator CCHC(Zn) family [Helianthus annuus]
MSNMSSLNELLRMEHEVGTTNKPPKMMKVENYLTWKDRFQSFIEYQDTRMWICIEDGYVNPTHDFEGRPRRTEYVNMQDNDKKMYEAEKRALAAIKMSLPDSIKHTFKKYTNSKDMWDALEKRYAGNADVKKNKIDLLKKQFAVFKYMKHESLEDVITRYYHLMSEIDNYEIDCYSDVEKNDKLLDALPTKWDIYTLMIKGEADYETKELEEVVGKLRAYELSMKKKDTGYDQVQDPAVYNGLTSSSSHNASSDSATAFLSCENEQVMVNQDGDVCFVAASGGSSGVKKSSASKQSTTAKSMPMSVKSAEEHLALLASFVASYENYIQGKISDPATLDEDYDQIDPDDLEEMDLQWQMAMISRRVKRFMNRTGRKFVGRSVGFDKTKVRCFNCQSYGHFARECQKQKQDNSSQSSNNRNASSNSSSKALISTAREGSYDWSIHLENDGDVSQAFMAEIAPIDDGEAKVDDADVKMDADVKVDAEVKVENRAEEKKVDQTTGAKDEKKSLNMKKKLRKRMPSIKNCKLSLLL